LIILLLQISQRLFFSGQFVLKRFVGLFKLLTGLLEFMVLLLCQFKQSLHLFDGLRQHVWVFISAISFFVCFFQKIGVRLLNLEEQAAKWSIAFN
jgi:hypothetical protein